MSWKQPEESVAAILRDGLDYVRDSFGDGTIDELLSRIYGSLNQSRRAEVKAWLASNEPRIVFSYPHDHKQTPCWAIVIDPKAVTQEYVGDDGYEEEDDDDNQIAVSAVRWQATVGVITYSENADLVRWLDHLATFLLARGRQSLADEYPYGQRLSGRDLQPTSIDGADGGRICFMRVLSVELEFDQTDAARTQLTDNLTGATLTGTANSPLDEDFDAAAA